MIWTRPTWLQNKRIRVLSKSSPLKLYESCAEVNVEKTHLTKESYKLTFGRYNICTNTDYLLQT